MKKLFIFLISTLMILTSGCAVKENTAESTETFEEETSVTSDEPVTTSVNDEGYTLEEMVVLARHNVRAPLSTEGSDLYEMTTHEWCDWSSEASELSVRGGTLETELGQYFRKYLSQKGLFDENEVPEENEVRIYANSLQRTIATAQYFSTGLLPLANLDVEYHEEIGTMDPVFNPQLTFTSESYNEEVMNEIAQMGGEDGINGIEESLKTNYELLEDVLDFRDSEYAKENNMTEFATDDLNIILETGKEPSLTGSLKLASSAADALELQYYEMDDPIEAAFGKELTAEEWTKIADIKTVYQKVLFTTKSVAINAAHPLLMELENELENEDRKFAFLCGHDSNLSSVLTALDFEEVILPDAIETATPIGSSIVMEKWKNTDNETFITFKMVYLSADQLRELQILDLDNEPMVYDLTLNGLDKNADGMYHYEDVMESFNEAINAYDEMTETYK